MLVATKESFMASADLVVALMPLEFTPLDATDIEEVKDTPESQRSGVWASSGSMRTVSIEDPVYEGETAGCSELYIIYTNGQATQEMHFLSLSLAHTLIDYTVIVDFDEGTTHFQTEVARAPLDPARYPAVTQRVLDTLARIADAML